MLPKNRFVHHQKSWEILFFSCTGLLKFMLNFLIPQKYKVIQNFPFTQTSEK